MKKKSPKTSCVAVLSDVAHVNDLDIAEKIVRIDTVENMNIYLDATPDQLQAITLKALEKQHVYPIFKTEQIASMSSLLTAPERYEVEHSEMIKSADEVLLEAKRILSFVGITASPILFTGVFGILSFLSTRLKP